MGLFSGIGKGLDKALEDNTDKQKRAEEMQRIMSGQPAKQKEEPKEIKTFSDLLTPQAAAAPAIQP